MTTFQPYSVAHHILVLMLELVGEGYTLRFSQNSPLPYTFFKSSMSEFEQRAEQQHAGIPDQVFPGLKVAENEHRFSYELLRYAYFNHLTRIHFSGQMPPPSSAEWNVSLVKLQYESEDLTPLPYNQLERRLEIKAAIVEWLYHCTSSSEQTNIDGIFISEPRTIRTFSESPLNAMLVELRNCEGHALFVTDGVLHNTAQFAGASIAAIEQPDRSGLPFAIQTLVAPKLWKAFTERFKAPLPIAELEQSAPHLYQRLCSDLAMKLARESGKYSFSHDFNNNPIGDLDLLEAARSIISLAPVPDPKNYGLRIAVETTFGRTYHWLISYVERYATFDSTILRPQSGEFFLKS